MLKNFEIGFEFTVFNDSFKNGKKKKVLIFQIKRKSISEAVNDGYMLVSKYLNTTYNNYSLDSFNVEVF